MSKCSGLFIQSISNKEKSVVTLTKGVNVIKCLTSSLSVGQNKLERLDIAILFNLIEYLWVRLHCTIVVHLLGASLQGRLLAVHGKYLTVVRIS